MLSAPSTATVRVVLVMSPSCCWNEDMSNVHKSSTSNETYSQWVTFANSFFSRSSNWSRKDLPPIWSWRQRMSSPCDKWTLNDTGSETIFFQATTCLLSYSSLQALSSPQQLMFFLFCCDLIVFAPASHKLFVPSLFPRDPIINVVVFPLIAQQVSYHL